ncbi:hypothetical protein PHYSODRAFT_338480 [Phytophthora sojae]|uniref:PexRD2 WYL domain-containing protein n=1 Tax=Phytophthora sojae (strain P6497) TaxID=1094619 RepID=G5A4Z2_PHYSP|nr:hypothetical protein PHYSODRAFT_338480 [Phytophthora sojae]EGZ09741.1 hypothetical protein PHYSODRAFT_338480 [Phytophthora sojae]|eukprot:XP_009534602.1 hypothetical protein PHYSODRAFT_338480 [Phytophthora sojae]
MGCAFTAAFWLCSIEWFSPGNANGRALQNLLSMLRRSQQLRTPTRLELSKEGPTQRFLRSHRTTVEDEDDSEERALSLEEMKRMMKAGMNEEAFAEELGVSEKMKLVSSQPNTGLATFLTSPEYAKIAAYQNFLIGARRDYANGVAESSKKAKSKKWWK